MESNNEQQVNLNIQDTQAIVCEECESQAFRPVVFLRKVSRFVSPDGQEHLWPLDSMECAKCGHINKQFNPVPKIENENGKN